MHNLGINLRNEAKAYHNMAAHGNDLNYPNTKLDNLI